MGSLEYHSCSSECVPLLLRMMSKLLTIEVYAKDNDSIVSHLQKIIKSIQKGSESGHYQDESANEYHEYVIE